MRRLLTIGCGGLVVVVLLIVVLAVTFGGGSDDTASSPSGGSGSGQQSAKKPAASKVGDTVKVGDVTWQVSNARQANQLTSQLGDSKQGNFVVVDFNLTNDGNEALTLSSESLALFDAKGRKFQTDTDTLGYVDPNKDIFLNQVNPGVTQQGEVIFTVAPDAKNFELELGDAAVFSDKKARVALGF